MNPQTIEQRQHDRCPFRGRGQLTFQGNIVKPIKTLDISAGGCSVVLDVNPPLKIQAVMHINLPVGPGSFKVFEVNVQVMNSIYSSNDGGFRLGLMFLKPPAPLVNAIERIIHPT